MKKIGFAEHIVCAGSQNPQITNDDGVWSRKVVDVRDYLQCISGVDQKHPLVALSFDTKGCYITMMIPLEGGRPLDYLSVWIYLPQEIDINIEKLLSFYNYIKDEYFQTDSGTKEVVKGELDEDHPLAEFPMEYSESSKELKYAYRDLSKDSLKEILHWRSQSYYSQYRAIFLLEKGMGIVEGKVVDNLTSMELKKQAIVVPPKEGKLKELGEGTKIYYNGEELKSKFATTDGTRLKFVLKRSVFVDIPIEQTVKLSDGESEYQVELPKKEDVTWKKLIRPEDFNIFLEEQNGNRKIDSKQVKINIYGSILPPPGGLFPEKNCKNAPVTISYNDDYDYFTINECNLLNLRNTKVYMKRKSKTYTWKIRAINGEMGEYTIKTKFLKLNNYGSPIEHYKLVEGKNGKTLEHLNYGQKIDQKQEEKREGVGSKIKNLFKK